MSVAERDSSIRPGSCRRSTELRTVVTVPSSLFHHASPLAAWLSVLRRPTAVLCTYHAEAERPEPARTLLGEFFFDHVEDDSAGDEGEHGREKRLADLGDDADRRADEDRTR